MFGITITSKEDYLSQDVMFGFTDYALAQKLLNQSENGDNDNDGDGVPDDVDTDDDDDGILDQIDQFRLIRMMMGYRTKTTMMMMVTEFLTRMRYG